MSMKSIFYIINSHFWKSITGPFFAFFFPVIMIMILGTLLGFDQVLGGLLSIPIVTIGLTILPTALFEFRSSSLLKRIGVTTIKPWMFMCAISLFYIIIMVASIIVSVLFSLIMFSQFWDKGRLLWDVNVEMTKQMKIYSPSFSEMLKHVNWGGFIYANLMSILVSTTLGLLISSLCKSSLSIQGISMPLLILSVFLSAQVIPIAMVKNINPLYYASYICPFKYSNGLIIESWQGNMVWPKNISSFNNETSNIIKLTFQYSGTQNIFNINQQFETFYNVFGSSSSNTLIFNQADKIVNLVMPYVLSGLFGFLALRRFKWSNR